MNAIGRDEFVHIRAWLLIVAVPLVAAGCRTGDVDEETVELTSAALNGTLIPTGGPLTRLTQSFTTPSESTREADTLAYYGAVKTGQNGVTGNSISVDLPTLTAFRNRYGFSSGEVVTSYYNRGDLGIGREMHCIDHAQTTGEIACYVRNFGAGDDGSEFTFGLSADIAFSNLHNNNAFATVAMVFRGQAAVSSKNRVFFAVYDKAENLAKAAALDRHGITFANAFKTTNPNNPVGFGTPGVNFNNHIPSNCIACHGGQQYDSSTHSETGALFLPFDLDQFAYENVAGRTRAEQETAFKHQNEAAWKVATISRGSDTVGDSIKAQIDTWYNNAGLHQSDPKAEVLENSYNSNAVPGGWVGFESIYRSVVRRSCRTCHVANEFGKTFDTESNFRALAGASVLAICNVQMPHSLQSIREFWQSTAPADLEAYLRSAGLGTQADQLHACGPGSIVTLDPPQLQAAFSSSAL